MIPFIADLAVKGTLLLILAFGAALLLRRASAAARHLQWQLTLGALLALPLLAAVTPRVAVPAGPLAALLARDSSAPVVAERLRTDRVRPPSRVAQPADIGEAPAAEPLARAQTPPPAPTPAAASRAPGAAAQPPERPIFTFRFALTPAQRLLAVWAAGAATVLGLLALGLLRARSLARRATPVTDPAWQAILDRVRRELDLHRRVELRRVPDAVVPMTFGWRRPLVLLPADSDRWSASRRRHVLLHELAHVRRGDWLGQLVAQVACAAWWWQPLTWLAARELRRHRELACDDAVLSAGNRPSEYADDLLAIASSRISGLSTGAATLAMARRSQLEGRLLAVLESGRRRAGPTPRRAVLAVAGTAALVTALACVKPDTAPASPPASPAEELADEEPVAHSATPQIQPDHAGPAAPAAPRARTPHADAPAALAPSAGVSAPGPRPPVARAPLAPMAPTLARPAPSPPGQAALFLDVEPVLTPMPRIAPVSIASLGYVGDEDCESDSTCIWSWNDGQEHWTVTTRGCVSPNEAVTDIGWIDEGGSFSIEHVTGDVKERVEARGADDEEGSDVVAWHAVVGGQELNGEPAHVEGLRLLGLVLQRTELFASERVHALVEQGGAAKAVETIRAMPAGNGRDGLLLCLLNEHELEAAEFSAVLAALSEGDAADSRLAEVLQCVGQDALGDPDLVEPVFKAVETIESDACQAETLQCLLGGDYVDAPVLARGLRTAQAGLDSDAYAAEVLRNVPAGRLRDAAVREAFVAALGSIESDPYQAEVLQDVLNVGRGVKADLVVALLGVAAQGVDSDAYMAEVLRNVPSRTRSDASVREALLACLHTVESDTYWAEVASDSLGDDATAELAVALLEAGAREVDSDAYLAEILQQVPSELLRQPPVRAAYEAALGSIQSAAYASEARERLQED